MTRRIMIFFCAACFAQCLIITNY